MDIRDVFQFLDAIPASEIVSDRHLAHIKNCAIDFLNKLPKGRYEDQWRVRMAVYMAELHCPGIHEVYLVNKFEDIKKTFLHLTKSIAAALAHEPETKNIRQLQLSYSYRLFELHIHRMKKIARHRAFAVLEHKLEREGRVMYERFLLHSEKMSGIFSIFHLQAKRKLKKHYYIYAFICGVGIVAFWHGFWGIFDFLKLNPFVTAAAGVLVLFVSGIFIQEFIGAKPTAEERKTRGKGPIVSLK